MTAIEHLKSLNGTMFMKLYERVMNKKASPRSAIKAMCQFCVGYEKASERVKDCTSVACPLWKYRPYQDKVETEESP